MENEKREIRYFSMFTGVGGFELGLAHSSKETPGKRDKESWQDSPNPNGELSTQGGSKSTFSCGGRASNDKFNSETQDNNERIESNTSKCNGNGRRSCSNDLPKTKRSEQRRNEGDSTKSEQKLLASKQFTCVGQSEIDKYANELLSKRFPSIKNWGDCTKINPSELPDFDMLCGGFPCQSFSIAGKRRGFKDTRGTLFFEIARILKVKRPKLVLLENVKGLLNHEKGKTFSVIIQTLEELGYEVQWMVLNSKFFGVPQNRERVFIIGSLGKKARPKIFPFGCNSEEINGVYENKKKIANAINTSIGRNQSDGQYVREILTPERKTGQDVQQHLKSKRRNENKKTNSNRM